MSTVESTLTSWVWQIQIVTTTPDPEVVIGKVTFNDGYMSVSAGQGTNALGCPYKLNDDKTALILGMPMSTKMYVTGIFAERQGFMGQIFSFVDVENVFNIDTSNAKEPKLTITNNQGRVSVLVGVPKTE